jgi:putative transposase
MKRAGIQALYRRPNTSKPAPGHKVFPYLPGKLAVTRPDQVRATDITCIPMARGFVYLVAVLDWFSRKVLAWPLSTTLETGPCIEALKEAMRCHGKPEIMNGDQGSQFTSIEFIKTLKDAGIQISMDGKGAWRDNVFVERFRRTIKYEEVYLRAYGRVSATRESLCRYLKFYNGRRPHSSLDGRTPDQADISIRCHQYRWRHDRAGKPLTKRLETVQKKSEPPLPFWARSQHSRDLTERLSSGSTYLKRLTRAQKVPTLHRVISKLQTL